MAQWHTTCEWRVRSSNTLNPEHHQQISVNSFNFSPSSEWIEFFSGFQTSYTPLLTLHCRYYYFRVPCFADWYRVSTLWLGISNWYAREIHAAKPPVASLAEWSPLLSYPLFIQNKAWTIIAHLWQKPTIQAGGERRMRTEYEAGRFVRAAHPMKFITTRCRTTWAKMKSPKALSGVMVLKSFLFSGFDWTLRQTVTWNRLRYLSTSFQQRLCLLPLISKLCTMPRCWCVKLICLVAGSMFGRCDPVRLTWW